MFFRSSPNRNNWHGYRQLALAAAAFGAAHFVAGTASATTITVLNPDFSSPVTSSYVAHGTVAPGSDTANTDWGIQGYGGVEAEGNLYSKDPTGQVPQLVGSQVAFADAVSTNTSLSSQPYNSDFYQNVGALQANTTYSLTVYTGFNAGYKTGEFGVLELVNGTSDTGTVLNSVAYTPSTAWPYAFEDISLTYTSGSTASGDLTVVLGVAGPASGDQIGFNNVRLTASPVPEPSAMGLLAVGGLSLLLVCRKTASRRSV